MTSHYGTQELPHRHHRDDGDDDYDNEEWRSRTRRISRRGTMIMIISMKYHLNTHTKMMMTRVIDVGVQKR